MKNYSKKALLSNVFGTLGYLFCVLSWGWVALLYLPALLENEQIGQFILPVPNPEVAAQAPTAETSLPMIILAAAVTIFILVATVVVLVRAPVTLAKTGRTVTAKAAKSAIPLIARGRPLPAAKKKLLTANLIKVAKLLIALLPVGAILLGTLIELPLPYDVATLVSSVLSLLALVWFSAQYISARLLGVDSKQLV